MGRSRHLDSDPSRTSAAANPGRLHHTSHRRNQMSHLKRSRAIAVALAAVVLAAAAYGLGPSNVQGPRQAVQVCTGLPLGIAVADR
jgi:hypothetical protein